MVKNIIVLHNPADGNTVSLLCSCKPINQNKLPLNQFCNKMQSPNILTNYTVAVKFILFVFIILRETNSANIVFFHTSGTASHRVSIWPLATKLADRGHNVTYIFPLSRRIGSHPNIKELTPSKAALAIDKFLGDFDINLRLNNAGFKWLQEAFEKVVDFCEYFYDSPEIKEWLSDPNLKIDLVLTEMSFGECAYGFVYKFKAKHILFNPMTNMGFLSERMGVPGEMVNIPKTMFHIPPGILSRVANEVVNMVGGLVYGHTIHKMEAIVREKLNLPEMPSFAEIDKNASLVLSNNWFVEDYPALVPPMFVSYSGISCTEQNRKDRKKLPQVRNAKTLNILKILLYLFCHNNF